MSQVTIINRGNGDVWRRVFGNEDRTQQNTNSGGQNSNIPNGRWIAARGGRGKPTIYFDENGRVISVSGNRNGRNNNPGNIENMVPLLVNMER